MLIQSILLNLELFLVIFFVLLKLLSYGLLDIVGVILQFHHFHRHSLISLLILAYLDLILHFFSDYHDLLLQTSESLHVFYFHLAHQPDQFVFRRRHLFLSLEFKLFRPIAKWHRESHDTLRADGDGLDVGGDILE